MRFQTTRCRERGAPELAFTLDDPSLASHAARWIARIEARAADGERWSAGQLFVLDGWPSLLVAADDPTPELHAQDLALPADAPPAYAPGLTRFARLSAAQWAVSEACGAAAEFAPPDYLQRVQVCPQIERTMGSYLLARSRPIDASFSGWVAQCGQRCVLERQPNELHVPQNLWREVPLYAFMAMRPGLVRYLALPTGSLVVSGERPRVLRRNDRDALPDTHNDALRDLLALPWSAYDPVATAPADTDPERVELDYALDADVWSWPLDRTRQRAVVQENHAVTAAAAARTVAHYMNPAMLRDRVRWSERDTLSPEQFAQVEARLREGGADAWKAAHAAAMALRAATGQPFAPLMKTVQRVQKRLAVADKGELERPCDVAT